MPIYEYNCEHCKYKFDLMVTTQNAQVKCPLCQGKVKKLMSSFSVGASHNIPGGIPAAAGPKMCTNC
jgi:putative FmdB family regulatory protein